MAFDFGAARWNSLDVPFPLIAAGNLGSAFMNKNAAGQVAGTSRRASRLVTRISRARQSQSRIDAIRQVADGSRA
jgi:hypothetical protein